MPYNFNFLNSLNRNQKIFVVVLEVVGGLFLRTGLLIGQLTIACSRLKFTITYPLEKLVNKEPKFERLST